MSTCYRLPIGTSIQHIRFTVHLCRISHWTSEIIYTVYATKPRRAEPSQAKPNYAHDSTYRTEWMNDDCKCNMEIKCENWRIKMTVFLNGHKQKRAIELHQCLILIPDSNYILPSSWRAYWGWSHLAHHKHVEYFMQFLRRY